MGKLIKKLNFTKNNSVKKAAKTAAISAVSALGGALLDGFHGTVELQNGREIKIKALPADHPYFAVAVEKNRTSRGLLITSAVFLTLIALSVYGNFSNKFRQIVNKHS